MPSVNGSKTTNEGQLTPQEKARIEKSVRGLEQAPSTRQQLGPFTNWKAVQNALGQPFNNERIPLSKLKLMRRDPMLAFGLHYQKMPKVKAPWYMKSSDVQCAAFMDGAIRPIIASLIVAIEQKKEFGFQAIAKRFALKAPDTTYIDPDTGKEVAAWDSTGGIEPVTFKQFIPLAPESVEPLFEEATGEFAGIKYKPPQGSSSIGQKAKGAGGSSGEVELDVYHSLWVTNMIESVFGNMFGYPLIGHAYPYWWSYWFRWAIADRAFEKKGDPAIIVRHPQGSIDLGNGESISNQDYALVMAERLRAGAAIALPSEPYTNFEDRPSTIREWEIEFLKGGVEMEAFDKSFDYMDVMKLRSIFVPEQALIEGGGGTSSRNVAEEMFEGLIEGQTMDMTEITDVVNNYLIPHLMLINFPQQYEQGVTCKMIVQGFTSTDTELLSQVIQLIGQLEPEKLGVDVRAALKQLGIPLLSQKGYEQSLKESAEKAALEGPKTVAPTATAAGVVPVKGQRPANEENTGKTSTGGSFTGFTYVPPVGLKIELSAITEAAASFMAELPKIPAYEDPTMRALTKQLWNAMEKLYRTTYNEFESYLNEQELIQLSDEPEFDPEEMDFAISDIARQIGRNLVNNWPGNIDMIDETISALGNILTKMMERGSEVSRKEMGAENRLGDDGVKAWVSSHVTDLVPNTIQNVREELAEFVGKEFHKNGEAIAGPVLARQINAHYGDFPKWMAARFSRGEARDTFNAATLLTGQENGFSIAQAIDALGHNTDRHCEERDGQFFDISSALREEEHSGGTLHWRMVKEPVTLSRVEIVPNAPTGSFGTFDAKTNTIYLSREIEPAAEREFLYAIGDSLS